MDDPWGSPWADEVQLPNPIKVEEKQDFKTPPTTPTPARAATLVLQEKTNSPWDDAEDDGFGEWATLPADNERDLGISGQVDDGEGDAPAPTVTIKSDFNAFSLDWDEPQEGQVDGNITLAPSPFLKAENVARLPSPDPWASSFTINNETAQNIPEPTENGSQDAIDGKGEQSEKLIFAPETSLQPLSHELLPDGEDTKGQEYTVINGGVEFMEGEDGDTVASPNILETIPTVQTSDGSPPSRPSSSPSDHSQHDGMSQESPRTSFDEEPTRPQIPRKVSSKIKELVEHFDGLAKQEVGDAAASSTSSGQDTIKGLDGSGREGEEGGNDDDGNGDEDEDDFGDFEEGHSDDEQEPPELESSSKVPEQVGQEASIHSEPPSLVQSNRKKFVGPVDFNIDTSELEKLYPNLEPDAPFERVFIMDTIPYDSFATTEERKTWNRISRYGTMRKHSTGDDDYVRINWPQSEIRKETLKIVARWMEEDRISGRVVLGGSSKGSSVFGWGDKKAAPIPLAHAFAAKDGKRKVEHAVEKVPEIPREWPQDLLRKSSTSKRSPSRTSRRSSMKPVESSESKSAVEQPVANFGWNLAPQKAQSVDSHPAPGHISTGSMSMQQAQSSTAASPPRRSPSHKRLSNSSEVIATLTPAQRSSSSDTVGQVPRATAMNAKLTSLATSELTSDDDDWGEMVASPVIASPSQTLLAQLPLQSKTATMFENPPILASAIVNQPVNHRSTSIFDDILKPQPASSKIGGQATTSFIDAFGPVSQSEISNQAAVPPVHSSVPAVDPWAMADFSFFESAPAPAPAPAPKVAKSVPRKAVKSVSFTPSTLGPLRSERKSRDEMEQDRIVQSVVKSLPDLSYMLKK